MDEGVERRRKKARCTGEVRDDFDGENIIRLASVFAEELSSAVGGFSSRQWRHRAVPHGD